MHSPLHQQQQKQQREPAQLSERITQFVDITQRSVGGANKLCIF